MARILVAHGIGYQFSGEHQVHQAYASGLLDGLALAGANLDSEIAVASYGDLFRPSARRCWEIRR